MSEVIAIPGVHRESFTVTIEGISPLISNAISDETRAIIEAKGQKKPLPASEGRDPQKEFQDAIYRTKDGRPGVPAGAFKSACVAACSFVKEATKVAVKGAFQIMGDILPIEGSEPKFRKDWPRPRSGALVVDYRAEYEEWSVDLDIIHNPAVMSRASIVNLFEHAGIHIGVGSRRPQCNGQFGMFQVRRRASVGEQA